MSPVAVALISMGVMLLCGVVLRLLGQMKDEWIQGLNALIFNLALPAMLVMVFQKELSPEILRDLGSALLWAVAAHALMLGAGYLLSFRAQPENRKEIWFNSAFSNAGFFGFPVVRAVFSDQPDLALIYASAYVTVFHLLALTLGRRMFDKPAHALNPDGTRAPKPGIGKAALSWLKTLASPALIAIAIGATLFAFGVKLPQGLSAPLDTLAAMTTPLSMLVVGARLGSIRWKSLLQGSAMFWGTALRQFLMPGLVLGCMLALGVKGLPARVILLEASMPAAAFLSIFAEKWTGNRALAARMVAFGTLVSVISVPLWTWVLGLL